MTQQEQARTAALGQAYKYASAIAMTFDCSVPTVWDRTTCQEKGYKNALAGVVMEGTGLGAFTDTSVLPEEGYGREFELHGMTKHPLVHAEPYASWLMLWYEN